MFPGMFSLRRDITGAEGGPIEVEVKQEILPSEKAAKVLDILLEAGVYDHDDEDEPAVQDDENEH